MIAVRTGAVSENAMRATRRSRTDPDAFGYDVPGREAVWERLTL